MGAESAQRRKLIGKHFGGPTWQLNDGSQVTGKLIAMTSIQRVNTVGGLGSVARHKLFLSRAPLQATTSLLNREHKG
jgi:hypothetical protein